MMFLLWIYSSPRRICLKTNLASSSARDLWGSLDMKLCKLPMSQYYNTKKYHSPSEYLVKYLQRF